MLDSTRGLDGNGTYLARDVRSNQIVVKDALFDANKLTKHNSQ
jgi:hypothetical protein